MQKDKTVAKTAIFGDDGLKTVVIVVFDGVQMLDVAGPSSVFSAVEKARPGSYEVIVASAQGGSIQSNSGITLAETIPLQSLPKNIDTVLIAGGDEEGLQHAVYEDGVAEWALNTAPTVRRMGSVCTGAFVLAAAGLLDDRQSTTHWYSCDLLQSLCPAAKVDAHAIFTIDPPIYTSAGVTTGIDLALALVEADYGDSWAAKAAKELVVFIRRPANQDQFSASLAAQEKAGGRVKTLITWMIENLADDLSVAALAAKAGMSERNFARNFKQETGYTPGWLVEQMRLEKVAELLVRSDWPLARIAQRSGFRSVDSLHRAFARKMGTTPIAYRQQHLSRAT